MGTSSSHSSRGSQDSIRRFHRRASSSRVWPNYFTSVFPLCFFFVAEGKGKKEAKKR